MTDKSDEAQRFVEETLHQGHEGVMAKSLDAPYLAGRRGANWLKIKRPGEWLIAIRRATGIPGDVRRSVAAFNRLGEPLWRPPAPKGFSDENAAWLDGLSHRLDTANAFAQGLADQLDPEAVAESALGPLASPATRQLIARAKAKRRR